MTLEEIRASQGGEIGRSGWLEVSQPMIDEFAALTHDPQWIHVEVERARKESPFGGTVAHGFLTLSLISHLVRQAVEVEGDFRMSVNYGLNRVRFPAPVPVGARIRARVAVLGIKDFEGGAEIVWDVKVEAEHATKPSLAAE